MDKRGQVYILAAVVLIIAIWGVVKVVNKIEPPEEDNFDFYVENFVGERAYVMDLGYLQGDDPTSRFVEDLGSEDSLFNTFTKLGFNVGLVMVVYDDRDADIPWTVVNFLSQNIETGCDGCSRFSIPAAQDGIGGISFSFTGGKKFFFEESDLRGFPGGQKYYVESEAFGNANNIIVTIDGNIYNFEKPIGKSRRVESLIFKNLDEDYIKVVKV